LQAARRGIVHRDLKPENIILTINGGVRWLISGWRSSTWRRRTCLGDAADRWA
jgi:serine/threonine protein kinase